MRRSLSVKNAECRYFSIRSRHCELSDKWSPVNTSSRITSRGGLDVKWRLFVCPREREEERAYAYDSSATILYATGSKEKGLQKDRLFQCRSWRSLCPWRSGESEELSSDRARESSLAIFRYRLSEDLRIANQDSLTRDMTRYRGSRLHLPRDIEFRRLMIESRASSLRLPFTWTVMIFQLIQTNWVVVPLYSAHRLLRNGPSRKRRNSQ